PVAVAAAHAADLAKQGDELPLERHWDNAGDTDLNWMRGPRTRCASASIASPSDATVWDTRGVAACLSEDTVAALVSGSLSPLELDAAERHLDGCASCRELVAQALHAPARAAPTLADVERIGRYRVLREVGCGAMGTVYAAMDPDL